MLLKSEIVHVAPPGLSIPEPVEYRGELVITLRTMAEAHRMEVDTISRSFSRNRDTMVGGEDYFVVPYSEWSQWVSGPDNLSGPGGGVGGPTGSLFALTETGYLYLSTHLRGSYANRVRRTLIARYWHSKSLQKPQEVQDHLTVLQAIEIIQGSFGPIVERIVNGQTTLCYVQEQMNSKLDGLDGRVGQLENSLASIQHTVEAAKKRVKFSPATVQKHTDVTLSGYNGKCPCCLEITIVNEFGVRTSECRQEHYFHPSQNQIDRTWLTCHECNKKLARDSEFYRESRTRFDNYQATRLIHDQVYGPKLPLFDRVRE